MQEKPRKFRERTVYVISGPESRIPFDDPQWVRTMDRKVRELDKAEKEKRAARASKR